MNDQHQGTHTGEVADPREGQQSDGGQVVHKHFPEIFALHVEKLGDAQGPVEAQLDHVVPPDIPIDSVMGIVVPAMLDVPQPRFGPQNQHAIEEDCGVVKASPTRFREFVQCAWFVLHAPPPEPSFHLTLSHTKLIAELGQVLRRDLSLIWGVDLLQDVIGGSWSSLGSSQA